MAVADERPHKGYHPDVAQAITKSTLDYEMHKLPGVCGELSGKYRRLEKMLHGLKQSGLPWNDLLVATFVAVHGTKQSKSDP